MTDEARRFPPPWGADRCSDGAFRILDANGVPIAYVYFSDPKQTTNHQALTEREAHRVAQFIARSPIFYASHQARLSLLHPFIQKAIK
jgi:hypothetical protein